jgi:hypothetical protein
MKSFGKFLAAVASTMVATMGAAHAIPFLPEPGSVSLVLVAVAGALYFGRRK